MAKTPDAPPFQLHLEPASPIALGELTGALAAIARQFEIYVQENELAARPKDARLLVSSVKPGSIDIGLLPDALTLGTLFIPFAPFTIALGFADKIKWLLDKFRKKDVGGVTVRDCDDAAAIVAPVANHGGTQTINVHNGDTYQSILIVTAEEAMKTTHAAARTKAELQFPNADMRQRVAMVWAGLDTDKPRRKGQRNPDKGLIEEIDAKPRPVFFEDEFAYLKTEMLEGEENPYRKIYFVDVVVSHVEGKVASYKIVGFHGTDERDEET